MADRWPGFADAEWGARHLHRGGNRGRRPPTWASREEMERFLEEIQKFRHGKARRWDVLPWNAARNLAGVLLMYRCGLRCQEMIHVQLDDIREKGRVVYVRRPKGYMRGSGKRANPREVGIDRRTRDYLHKWLFLRRYEPGPFVCSRDGGPTLTQHWRRVVSLAAKRAGISRPFSPHSLRHTYARELWEDGVDLVTISRALGHRELKVTQIYLQSIGATEVVAATSKREW